MPIIIPKKNSSKGTFSNKPQMPSKIQSSETNAPVPFIDKISLVIHYDNAIATGLMSKQYAHDIYSAVINSLDDTELFKVSPKTSGYQITKRIPVEHMVDVKKWPLFQFAYDKGLMLPKTIRLEFVPVDLGGEGMDDLHIKLMTFLPDGWEHVIKYARITRLDIAVDLPNTSMENLILLPATSLTASTWTSKGSLESVYFGKSKGSQTKVYSRSNKRKAKGQKWQKPPEVRVERKLINLKELKLTDLEGLKNPFLAVAISNGLPGPPPKLNEKKHWQWELFKDSSKVRQIGPALALLPNAMRLQFRKHIIASSQTFWDPDGIWSNWPETIEASKLAGTYLYP